MKLIFIRHGEPDYEHDTLTPKGWREAELLSNRISKLNVRDFYCSPLGRAKDTASLTLKKMGRTATVLDWLQEVPKSVTDPETGKKHVPWDFMPDFWTVQCDLYDKDKWFKNRIMAEGNVGETYRKVSEELDTLLRSYGYSRSGMLYRTEAGNCDTIVFFCHLGVTCLMLSHLIGIAAPVLWQGFFLAPTSVTTVETEERKKGEAFFRCKSFGDVSHLYVAGEPASNSGFFNEMY
ncbi:MAG TPA: histidine phosphatase family protein [Ruminococcaceae bacterium]|jgi:probable phosphoglycerate mutase|nr:histidine phosphatase family protein [Oscillospiraceae bacterium]